MHVFGELLLFGVYPYPYLGLDLVGVGDGVGVERRWSVVGSV